MSRRLGLYVVALGFAVGGAPMAPADEHHPAAFGTIDFPGATSTVGRDVTPAGDAYVGEYDDAAGHHGFLLRRGSFTAIDVPGATSTDAHGINASGDIVGVYRSAEGEQHGYLLDSSGFTSFDVPDATGTSAMSINDRGDIVSWVLTATARSHPVQLRGIAAFC